MFDTILERGKKHDEESLMQLYDICCDAVFNASYRILSNEQDAEEITHDAILKVFDNLHKFKGSQSDFIALAKTIVINKSIDVFRKRQKSPLFIEINETAFEVQDETYELENFSVDDIKTALNALPDGYRLTVTLHLIDEIDFKNIAKILKIKESTARSQYFRGIKRIREQILKTNSLQDEYHR